MPWLGYVPDDVAAAPAAVVARLSEKLGIPPGELRGYGAREQTRTGHLREVRRLPRLAGAGRAALEGAGGFLVARAMEHDSPKLLFQLACEYLSSARLVRSGVVSVLERVAADAARIAAGSIQGPGGHAGNDSVACMAGSHPERQLFGHADR